MQTLENKNLKRTRQLPLSQAQKELWLLTQIGAEASVAYNVSTAVELRGPLVVDSLRKALRAAVERHDALRAGVSPDGETLTVVDGLRVKLEFENISELSAEGRLERLRSAASREFDLTTAPLFRAHLFQTGPLEHTLLLTSHHIVVDGASINTLIQEIGALYSSFSAGRERRLAARPDYEAAIARQERQRGAKQWQAAEDYWLKRFDRNPPVLELPTDKLRPNIKTYSGAAESLLIEPALKEKLEALGNAHDCTLFMTLFAAFTALTHRLSGQDELVLGINVSGRTGKADRDVVGYLTGLLPIRTITSGQSFVSELLANARDTLLEGFEHRQYSLGNLVRKLNPPRVPGRSPLVDVTFNFDRDAENFRFDGLEARLVPPPLTAAKYDLDFNVVETQTGLLCYAEYNTDLFHPETIQRILRLWKNLLRGFAEGPQSRLVDLPWLEKSERQQTVVEWNRTEKEYPKACVTALLETRAERTPNATAIAYEGIELSYRELNAKANRLARYLLTEGVGRETRVGVCLERGLDWVVAILAIWKAGGVYVPLDAAYPKERLGFMLEDAAAGALLTETSIQSDLLPYKARAILVDLEWEAIDRQSDENLGLRNSTEDLAYIMYTSGSTGRPKGAMIEHGGMLNHLWAKVDDLGLSAQDVVAQNATASFDVSVWQIFSVLLVGGVVQIIGEEIARDGSQLLGEVHRVGATVLETVPTLLGTMVEHQRQYGERRLDLRRLRWVISNAEPLPVELCRQWGSLYPRVGLINAYGQTECSDDVNHLRIQPSLNGFKYAPLGRPLKNMRIYVLDEWGNPVPIGVAGELHVGGICVGRGYLGRPSLTAEKFTPDPFSHRPGARLYRTGDRVRLLPDGTFDFIARLDHQVKLRGLRIELPEIEATLNQHPDVLRSVVIIREDEPGDQRLVAYVVLKGRTDVNSGALKAFLQERLPQYMTPSAIEILDRMPLTANEKIDRAALPKPKDSQRDSDQEFLAPRNQLEETLAEIWAELLHVERVGIDDNFFELGGHSLLATQVVAKIRKTLQVELPLRRLFEVPTIIALAKAVEEARSESRGAVSAPIERAPRDLPLPLSYAQERLWFLRQFETDLALYNMLSVLRIEGDLQLPIFERALEEIIQRHEVLRTSFVEEDGVPRQIINPPWPVQIPVVDLRGEREEDRKTSIERFIQEEVQRPFDLANGPLLRFKLLRVGDADHIFLVGMHHIAGDGWSMEVFFQDLAALYDAFLLGTPSPLADLPFQYVDYAVWQRNWLEGEVLDSQLAYWKDQLKGIPHAIDLPTTSARPAAPSHRAKQHSFMLSRELSDSVQTLSHASGVTLFVTLLSAFQALLSRYSGQTDIVVGGAVANRNGQLGALMGFFINSLVLRADLSDRPGFSKSQSWVEYGSSELH
jgi:amino acid adenylation domain-containing protein